MKIRVIDLETTGLAAPEHAPCEVGWTDIVQMPDKTWRIDETRSRLCNPGRSIPPEASAIHHITDKHVRGTPLWHVVLSEICSPGDIAGQDIVAFAAHNSRFDGMWVNPVIANPDVRWICTYRCALRLWPDAPSHSNQALRYWLDLDIHHHGSPHRAGHDSYVTARLLEKMLQGGATGRQLLEWSSQPARLKKVTFGQHYGKLWSEVDTGFLQWVLKKDFDEDVRFTVENEIERRRMMG